MLVFSDYDGVFYTGKYMNFSVDTIKLLDRNYGYHGIFEETLDVFTDVNKCWKEKVEGIVKIVGDYKVSSFDQLSAANKISKSSEISEEIKTVLEMISPKEMIFYTGSITEGVSLHVNDKIRPIVPSTKIRVCGTQMEVLEGLFTGKALEVWDSSKRAEKTRELKGNKDSIGFGNSLNDVPMLNENTKSYFLTGPTTKTSNGYKEGSIVYTDLKSLPLEVSNFLNSKRE